MDTATLIVVLVGIVLAHGVLLVALHRKGDVRAGAKMGGSSFVIEVKDRKQWGSGRLQ
jgi:hypothetical protein